ncbi:MAG TPA: alpha/beta hydrolase [Thermoanaerobaculia bacterium]
MLSTALLLVSAVVRSGDAVPIHYTADGKGEPALVFVHCWTCDRRFWDAQMAFFSRDHRVVAMDLAGHGESGGNREDWTIEAFGDDVRAVVDALGLRRVVLVGSSMGGLVSLEAARRLGSRVVGIVPVDSLLDFEYRMKPGEVKSAIVRMQGHYRREASRFITQYLFSPSTPPAVRRRVLEKATSAPPGPAVAMLHASWVYDPLPALAEIRAPIRAINSDKYPTNLAVNRRHSPGFKARIMKGAGHYLMIEDPDRFNQLLAAVLRDLR